MTDAERHAERYAIIARREPAPETPYIIPRGTTIVHCGDLPGAHAGYIHAEAALSAAGFHYNIGCDAWMLEAI